MPKFTQPQFRQAFRSLPEDLQDAIDSTETSITIRKIGEKYKLHIDQSGNLADEIGEAMVGLTTFKEFTDMIKNSLGVTAEQATGIIHDVNTEIFAKTRGLLKQLQLERILSDAPAVPGVSDVPVAAPPPDPAAAVKESLFKQKMTTLYNVPKEDVEVKPKTSTEPVRPSDPYREIV